MSRRWGLFPVVRDPHSAKNTPAQFQAPGRPPGSASTWSQWPSGAASHLEGPRGGATCPGSVGPGANGLRTPYAALLFLELLKVTRDQPGALPPSLYSASEGDTPGNGNVLRQPPTRALGGAASAPLGAAPTLGSHPISRMWGTQGSRCAQSWGPRELGHSGTRSALPASVPTGTAQVKGSSLPSRHRVPSLNPPLTQPCSAHLATSSAQSLQGLSGASPVPGSPGSSVPLVARTRSLCRDPHHHPPPH